ncbi:MAG TPA: Rieske 2Fe-2S domain-containing protein [Candidatus Lustribacter sp.]|jgi:phthalate 4,5-dioxygenase oxygenase subunit|nr:Rieske 2Fe-2S domain-containing protein [Candidatus Lustribacter sp.]
MLTRQENEMLCRVGPDTPMGRMMRRYWVPVAMTTELVAGTPKRVRMLGENFVAFRGDDGVAGVLDESCPHRGASLVLARSEGCALRCLYHGWKVDRTGAVLEMPSEPDGTAFTSKVRQPAYPVYESAGIAWTYLGPPDVVPPVPYFAYARVPDSHRANTKFRTDCNWVQSLEGAIDTAHSNYLHSDDIRPGDPNAESRWAVRQTARPSNDGRPRILTEDMPYGFRYGAIRRPLVDPERQQYVRVTHFVAPFTAVIPLGDLQNVQIFLPIDDEHTYQYNVKFSYTEPPPERMQEFSSIGPSDGDWGTNRNHDNNWRQDREAMKAGTSFTGIEVIRNQDTAVQESMGPLYDRTKEHLGVSDTAIIRMRRRMLESVRAFEERDAVPLGLAEPFDYGDVVAAEGMLPLDAPWQDLLRARTPA